MKCGHFSLKWDTTLTCFLKKKERSHLVNYKHTCMNTGLESISAKTKSAIGEREEKKSWLWHLNQLCDLVWLWGLKSTVLTTSLQNIKIQAQQKKRVCFGIKHIATLKWDQNHIFQCRPHNFCIDQQTLCPWIMIKMYNTKAVEQPYPNPQYKMTPFTFQKDIINKRSI